MNYYEFVKSHTEPHVRFINDLVQALVDELQALRTAGNYAAADAVRAALVKQGVSVMLPKGQQPQWEFNGLTYKIHREFFEGVQSR